EYYTAKIHTFAVLPHYTDTITDISEKIVWDANSEGFFYTKMDKNHRPSELYYHRLNTDQAQDKLIFYENDPGFFLHVSGSKLNDFIYINIHDHETSEIWLIPANAPFTYPQCVRKREKGIEYS
ncbi:MAG: S9 family peptidase, partial [Bartonella sp.]|nr:S9 family peptidase [Bartonella sp.]